MFRRNFLKCLTALPCISLPNLIKPKPVKDFDFSAHCQNINISTNLGREELFELGRKGPYYRYITFPIDTSIYTAVNSKGEKLSFYGPVSVTT